MVCVLWACGPTVVRQPSGDSTRTSGEPAPSSGEVPPPPLPATSSTTDDSADDGSDDAPPGIFVPDPDGGLGVECDLFTQNCPAGEKCTPWANDGGGAWNSTRCSPIAEEPGEPGDPCVVEGSNVSGIDSCDLGAMCWYVDPKTNEGRCSALCTGDESNPRCDDPSASCTFGADGVLYLCLPTCDPVAQDCPPEHACYSVSQVFTCVPDGPEEAGAAGDPCQFINGCEEGTGCVSSDLVPGCERSVGCCTAYCDLGDEMPPCLPGQECVAWFDREHVPPGFEHVGFCILPE